MSPNKPKKHAISTELLPFISLINIYLDLSKKSMTLKQTFCQYNYCEDV